MTEGNPGMFATWTRRAALAAAIAAPLTGALAQVPAGQQPASQMTAVMQADVRIMDPHVSTVYITRNFAYMVWDTLFAMDSQGNIRPQMVDTHTVSDDRMTWTFTLREGLKFHDGQPVTSADVIASLRRWGPGDGLGRHLMAATASMDVVDARTFRIVLNRPFGLVLDALGKPSSLVPAIMPERLAQRPRTEQNSELIGSGPFVFRRDISVAGATQVFDRYRDYRPREEPADFLSGGKRVHFDRVTWRVIPDAATAANALTTGEVDFIEMPAFDLLPLLRRNRGVTVVPLAGPSMWQGSRFNTLQPPFNNPAIRRAVAMAVDQRDYLRSVAGDDPAGWGVCEGVFTCDTPLANEVGSDALKVRNIERAKAALQAAGYNGEKVVLIAPGDYPQINALSMMTADIIRRLGMNLELIAADWGTLVQRRTSKEPVERGGWSIIHTTASGQSLALPVFHLFLRANGDQAWFGWPNVPEVERLRAEWVEKGGDPAESRRIAQELNRAAMEAMYYVPLGYYWQPSVWRRNVTGAFRAPAAAELIGYVSLPFGVVTLAERAGASCFTEQGFGEVVELVAEHLRRFDRVHCIGQEIRAGGVRLMGTSGTVTTLAGVAMALPRYRRPLVDGQTLDAEVADQAIGDLFALGREGLAAHPCVGPDRVDFVLPGCAVYAAIRRVWPVPKLTVADRGLREGILLRLMRADRGGARRGAPPRQGGW